MGSKRVIKLAGILLVLGFVVLSIYLFDINELISLLKRIVEKPGWFMIAAIIYGAAFVIRAWGWWLYLSKKVAYRTCLNAIWYSLFFNHLLPFKPGEVVRAMVITEKKKITWDEALNSVIVMRIIDLSVIILISSIGFLVMIGKIPFQYTYLMLGLAVAIAMLSILVILINKRSVFLSKHLTMLQAGLSNRKGLWIIAASCVSWMLEGAVIFAIAKYVEIPFTALASVWANSVTVGGSIFQVAPGGMATYESILSSALYVLGVPIKQAYVVAIISHGFKFLFAYIVGGLVLLIYRPTIPWKKISWEGRT